MPSASKYLKKKLELFSDANCITTMVERNGNRTPKLGSLNQVIINIYMLQLTWNVS